MQRLSECCSTRVPHDHSRDRDRVEHQRPVFEGRRLGNHRLSDPRQDEQLPRYVQSGRQNRVVGRPVLGVVSRLSSERLLDPRRCRSPRCSGDHRPSGVHAHREHLQIRSRFILLVDTRDAGSRWSAGDCGCQWSSSSRGSRRSCHGFGSWRTRLRGCGGFQRSSLACAQMPSACVSFCIAQDHQPSTVAAWRRPRSSQQERAVTADQSTMNATGIVAIATPSQA